MILEEEHVCFKVFHAPLELPRIEFAYGGPPSHRGMANADVEKTEKAVAAGGFAVTLSVGIVIIKGQHARASQVLSLEVRL